MQTKHLIGIFVFPVIFFWVVYATNTIRVTVPETTNDVWVESSYTDQLLYIQSGALKIINVDNDDILAGDYFSWYYFDSAYWHFYTEYRGVPGDSSSSERVSISSEIVSDCTNNTSHIWYKLDGFSYSPDFWAMNFNHDATNYVYMCVPRLENSDELSYLWWNAYSELIGTQNFSWVTFDAFVDRTIDHSSDARFVRVEGVSSSQRENTDSEDFEDDIRILGNVQKSELRRNILQNVYSTLKNSPTNNATQMVNSLGSEQWSDSGWGTVLLNGTVLYFWNLGTNKTVEISGTNDLAGVKTVVVEWWDIFIRSNIIDEAGEPDMLGIIAIRKDDVGWNILIDSSVTDIHASMYADRSILSSVWWVIADGDTPDTSLVNQLYIEGSIFSENTTWWALTPPYICPFFEEATCTQALAKKYDLSFLRRYILVSDVDADGNPTGTMSPLNWWAESEMWDRDSTNTLTQPWKTAYRVYPLIIDYDSDIQIGPPPFFWN